MQEGAMVTADSLRRLRDRRFHRLPARRVQGERGALAFVREVGFCSTFYRFPEGVACLWEAVAGRANPRWPRHSHHDAGIGLTWELKDTLPARKRVYYGKLLKGHPLLVALDLFPAFYALVRVRQRARDYCVEYQAGRLSHEPAAARVLERYTRGAVFTTERALVRLFGLTSDEVARAVMTLRRTNAMRTDCAVEGWPGRWLIHA